MRGQITSERVATGKKTRILLVDDHPIVRQGLKMMIDNEADLQVCGEADGMARAMQVFFDAKPEVVIADISLENGSGIELVKELMSHHSPSRHGTGVFERSYDRTHALPSGGRDR
jgi:DNA-binding NarL/FixJ family response regulator